MSKLALKLIRENIEKHKRGEDASFLDLGNCGMTEVPEEIRECVWVEELVLSHEWWEYDFRTTEDKWRRSQNKGKNNQIKKNVSILSRLFQLKKIVFRDTEVSDLSFISTLTNLQILDCSYTHISNLSFIVTLGNLQILDCSYTQISDLSPLETLINLKMLNCSRTQVSNLSPLAHLIKLNHLNCFGTKIKNLFPLRELANLKVLDCSSTQVGDLSPIVNLDNLKNINCSTTNITDLFPILPLIKRGMLVKWDHFGFESGIYIEDCPLIHPPPETVQRGHEAILNYFFEREKSGEEKSLEAKVILIGEGMAGKTSLRVRLIHGEMAMLPEEDNRTKGLEVEIEPFYVDLSNGERLRLNLFDFGGQKHYKPLHQFFYSHRSLYVLVSRNGDPAANDFDFWFDTAQLFGGRSPVLVVNNLFGDVPSGFSRSHYERFDSLIKDNLDTNLGNCKGFSEVKKRIGQLAEDLPHVHKFIPKSWANVRRSLEGLRMRNIIPLSEYLEICAKKVNGGMDKDRALFCSAYLHDIGACLHYQQFPALKRYVIVRNEWATEAVYRIMDDLAEKRLNKFDIGDLERIFQWQNEDSEQDEDFHYENYIPELLELMRNFKLCYPLKDNKSYVSPSLLPVKLQTDPIWQPNDDLQYEIEYDFMPPALFSRFIVSRYEEIGGEDRDQVWRDEVFFQWEDARACVSQPSRSGKKVIVFKVQGRDLESRKLLLTSLLRDLKELHKETPGIKIEERIPCICDACKDSEVPIFFPYSKLKSRKDNKKNTIECDKPPFDDVNIDELLGNIFSTREHIMEGDSPEIVILSLIKEGFLEDALVQMDEAGYPDSGAWLGEFRSARRMWTTAGAKPAEFSQTESRLRAAAIEMLEKRQK